MRRTTVRRKTTLKRTAKKSIFRRFPFFRFFIAALIVIFIFVLGYHYRNGLTYYLGYKSHNSYEESKQNALSNIRNFQVLTQHQGKSIGLDVSEYQGTINWPEVDFIEEKYPLDFVIIRATIGNDSEDKQFKKNWLGAKENKMIRAAYHYYRPNENSIAQANLFIKTVILSKGDLPPVLDIEQLPINQSLDSLKMGLKRWLKIVETHYNVRPIIYTSEKYYDDFLKKEFGDYLFWIANYNFYREKIGEDWLFWQFTEKGSVPGIKGNVDVNIYNGDVEQLRYITKE